MKPLSGLDTRRLLNMLGGALVKEADAWKPVNYRLNTSNLVGF